MSDKAPPVPGRWPPSTIIAGIMVLVVLGLAAGNALWNRGIEQGKTEIRSQYDPTASLRAEMQALKDALTETRQQLAAVSDVASRLRQAEADIARDRKDGSERDAGQDRLLEALRNGVAEQRERLAVIERTSSIPLPGARR